MSAHQLLATTQKNARICEIRTGHYRSYECGTGFGLSHIRSCRLSQSCLRYRSADDPCVNRNLFEEAVYHSVKAAGSWLSMSISPMTFPWA
jgi:hypothetical protein